MAFAHESEDLSQTLVMVHGEVVGDAWVPLPRGRCRRRYGHARRHKEVGMQVIRSEKILGYKPTLWATARTWAPWQEITRSIAATDQKDGPDPLTHRSVTVTDDALALAERQIRPSARPRVCAATASVV